MQIETRFGSPSQRTGRTATRMQLRTSPHRGALGTRNRSTHPRALEKLPPDKGPLPVAPRAGLRVGYARGSPMGGAEPRDHLAPIFTSRCNAARVRGQCTSPHPRRCCRGIELGERRAQGIKARGVENLSSLGGFGRRASRAASTATTAIPGVVLCVADGIVRIVVRPATTPGAAGDERLTS
jgi:hypothetical protein